MKKNLMFILTILLALYLLICGLFFFFQEQFLFFPEKLDKNHQFSFGQKFEEINVTMKDGISLHGLLFKADSSKGLIFYLHGNAGSLRLWGEVAKTYTDLNYDVFVLDYRGYGKSEGAITGQGQLFSDIQTVYDELKKRYSEDKIIVLGYSIGTGPASKIAAINGPKLLILQAPFYNLKDLIRNIFPIIPPFVLKYKMETNKYIKDCTMPVVIFHGNQDEVIYHGSSIKLKEHFKEQDSLIFLNRQGHNGMTDNEDYKSALQGILEMR
ncbi:MAG: alpha/beta fold hydrolase [Anditalea sp.]